MNASLRKLVPPSFRETVVIPALPDWENWENWRKAEEARFFTELSGTEANELRSLDRSWTVSVNNMITSSSSLEVSQELLFSNYAGNNTILDYYNQLNLAKVAGGFFTVRGVGGSTSTSQVTSVTQGTANYDLVGMLDHNQVRPRRQFTIELELNFQGRPMALPIDDVE
jgi:hypothetical protein